jgi:hypothetical protein
MNFNNLIPKKDILRYTILTMTGGLFLSIEGAAMEIYIK